MGKPHMIAAVFIVLSTSLLAPSQEPGSTLQGVVTYAGGRLTTPSRTPDQDAPLLINKK